MIVVKYGGHVLDDPQTNENIISTIAKYHRSGGKVVIVHGGGPSIEASKASSRWSARYRL